MKSKYLVPQVAPIITPARYTFQIVHAWQGNPFDEAIPDRLSSDDFYAKFNLKPPVCDADRLRPVNDRLDLLSNLRRFFVAFPHHLDLYDAIYEMIKASYERRNPLSPEHWVTLPAKRQAFIDAYSSSVFAQPHPRLAKALVGCAGLAKSTFIEMVLPLFPMIISHSRYIPPEGVKLNLPPDGFELNRLQLPYIYVEASKNSSIMDICLQVFTKTDSMMNTHYVDDYGNQKLEVMLAGLVTVCHTHAIGLIVFDELQELSLQKSGGMKAIVSSLLRVTNILGVAVLLVGTPKSELFDSPELRHIKRSSCIPEWRNFERHSNEWNIFFPGMWKHQFTKTATPISEPLSDVFHELTMGIPDFAVTLYELTQHYLIRHSRPSDTEIITPEFVEKIAVTHMAKEVSAVRNAVLDAGTTPARPTDLPSKPVRLRLVPNKTDSEAPKAPSRDVRKTGESAGMAESSTESEPRPPQTTSSHDDKTNNQREKRKGPKPQIESVLQALTGTDSAPDVTVRKLKESGIIKPGMEFELGGEK